MQKFIITFLMCLVLNSGHGQAELKTDFEKAVKLLQSKNYEKAAEIFSAVLNKAADDKLKKFCYIYRAFSYNGLENYSKAISDLDKAIELDPSDIASYTDRGKSKGYADDLDGAKQDFLFVLAKDSTGKQAEAALYYLGKIAYQQQAFEESIKYYDRFIILMPRDPEVYFNRAAAKERIFDTEGSIRDYDKAIQLDQGYKEAYANRGVAKINLLRKKGNILLTKEQTSDACADLKKAKQLGDNTVDDMIFVHCDKN